ncbi:auxin-responsive protein SAUR72-like protein [Cinnamomum micranthum f. kanehirae]|uniref:Auxin-responsive protein SAUR72-like protein n=1 Tax=Cinnamomum micranthum f. kanehirae TaxID=337451 RepID=A0A3S3NIK6_9MAGN|nr:auxin-responsive protein SAUR72-like protein [Cinnamomum micranthum f. kanehirae]
MGVNLSKISRIVGSGGVGRRRKGSTIVPKGYVPVYVGAVDDQMKRFIVHTTSLGDAYFLELLCKSAEEYGFCDQGVLRIPYDAKVFEEWMVRKANWKMRRVTTA